MTLAKDVLHELFIYDSGVLRNKIDRGRARAGNPVGITDSYGYLVASINGTVHKVHRLIYAMFYDEVPKIIDHVNGNKEDNRIENLRPATNEQNGWNRKIDLRSTTGVKGVTKVGSKYQAQCKAGGDRVYLGLFTTLEEADKALKNYRSITQKEFARHE